MAMVINTNALSLNAQNNLNKSQQSLNTAIERLSSGSRINSAKDDAAGLAISNRMNSQVTGLNQANRNANDGISVAQTAEGALGQVTDNLQRIRELTVQAQNGTLSDGDKSSIQNEITQRMEEINRISEQTQFNGKNLLDGSSNTVKLQVGANDGQTIDIKLGNIDVKSLGLDGFNVDGKGVISNKAATLSNVQAQNGTNTVTTTFKAATADQVLSTLKDGNTVDVDGTEYKFDAASGNFSVDKTLDTDAGDVAGLANKLKPASGSVSGTYEFGSGDKATFDVDQGGKVTINDQAAYLNSDGELTTNDASGSGTQATLEDVLKSVGSNGGSSLSIGGTKYENSSTNELKYSATASKADVKTAMAGSATASTVTTGKGIEAGSVAFAAGSTTSSDTYVDNDGEFTKEGTFSTTYAADADTGEVTVVSSTGTGKNAAEVGAKVYVDDKGQLTTKTTHQGDASADPLATLDAALSQVDDLRSGLGAVQNRLQSTVEGNSTTSNNLSAAMSQIKDADYATEVSNMSKAQILQQAGTSVLAQANQTTQGVMSLLR